MHIVALRCAAGRMADARSGTSSVVRDDAFTVGRRGCLPFRFRKVCALALRRRWGPLHICVAATPSFVTGVQRTIANETIDGRALDVREVSRPEDEAGCAILFIDASQGERSDAFLQAAADKPILTVSDLPDFLARGGMIQFQIVQKRVRFSVSLDAVNRSHLLMSSELLKVAMDVKGHLVGGGAQ